MKPVLIALCVLISCQATAQRFSAGARTGASHWFSLKTNTYDVVKSKNEMAWEQSGYLRYETKKRLSLELDVAHYNFTAENWWEDDFESGCAPWGPPPVLLNQTDKRNTIEYTLSGQYRITPATSKIKSYVGANVSVATEYFRYSDTYYYPENGQTVTYTNQGILPTPFGGLNNYTSVAITSHLNINSEISLKIDPFDAFSDFMPYHTGPNSKFTWKIGCGYTF